MGTRSSQPIAYWDRVHPAVICTGMVCVLLGFLGVVAGTLGAMYLHLDPEPILKYLGPSAVLVALAGLLNQAGVVGLKSQLGRMERYLGTGGVPAPRTAFDDVVDPPRTYSASDASAVTYAPPGSTR